jgi:putative ABC transport system ATP-binding protein
MAMQPMEQIQYAVHCKDLMKVYGEGSNQVMALRGVNLDIIEGEFLILAGPSGCGKTTLISVIAGILDQSNGLCMALDKNLYNLTEIQRLKFRSINIGFVFQQFNLIPTLTAAENVAIPLIINGIPLGEAVDRSSTLLKDLGLEGRQQFLPKQLSGGQQQRVAIARSIIHNPKLVVCDEPTSALDAETGHMVMNLMKTLAAARNLTIIVVTHDSRVYGFADRIAQMEDGRILRVVHPQEVPQS